MKFFKIFLAFLFLLFSTSILNAEDSLTVKQQLDRIKEEVKDLNKAVFNKSFDKNNLSIEDDNDDTERFTSIDIRIYDLEKDIKNLTLQFEEILFEIDDLTKNIISLESEMLANIKNLQNTLNNTKITSNNSLDNNGSNVIKEENTLGKLVLSDNIDTVENSNVDKPETKNNNKIDELYDSLPTEEKLQYALDQMMKKNYDKSKTILENFISDFPENQLSGSAHFWLGKIYLFESNYRKAAIVFGEGVQKFPKSIKAAEMYYELSKSLIEMKKIPEACKTLVLLDKNYKGNKFSKDPEKIKDKVNCKEQN